MQRESASAEEFEPLAVCIPNINARERRRRLVSGVIILGINLVFLTGLGLKVRSRWWRLLAFPGFWVGAASVMQWSDRT